MERYRTGLALKLKLAMLFAALSLSVFSNVSCAAAPEEQKTAAQAQKAAPEPPKPAAEPQKPAAEVQQPKTDEPVYLKVEKAFASSFDETPDWAPKPDAMAVADNDPETRWSSGYNDNEWIYLDFGKVKTVSKIVIKWEQAYSTKYDILVSNDAKEWKRVAYREEQDGGTDEIMLEPVACRYVKLVGAARVNDAWGISVWELEPYGPKDKNPGDHPIEKLLEVRTKEKSEIEKKREEVLNTMADIVPSPGPITEKEFQRGVNYTSWNTDELSGDMSDCSLIYLSQIGVGHIALMTVYYQDDAAAEKIYSDDDKSVSDESVGHAINFMHALGMKVMLKPHVDLADEEARSNIIPSEGWFNKYKIFILHYATIAAKYNVELFCIGTELSNTTTSRWKDRWLDIIKAIRDVYKGPITYAANWDEYDTVSFWNEVDYIGMDAYFPLTKTKNPPKEELVKAWEAHADTLEKWLKENNLSKPIIFTEIGYDTIEGSNMQPWRVLPTLADNSESQDEQANCLESLLVVLSKRSWFKGFYWWNYFPRPDIGALGYTLRGKKGEKILTEWFNKLK